MFKWDSILAILSIAFLIYPLVLLSHASVVLQSWPCSDFDESGTVDIADFLLFVDQFGTSQGIGHTKRSMIWMVMGLLEWVDLNRYDPSALSSLKSETGGGETEVLFVNLTQGDIVFYWVDFDGNQRRYGRVVSNGIAIQNTYTGHVWLIKSGNGSSPLAVFQAVKKTGRALTLDASAKPSIHSQQQR